MRLGQAMTREGIRGRSSLGWLLGVTAIAVSCLLALAGVELALGMIEWSRPKNDLRHWTWGHRVAENSLGFRERELAVPKPPGGRRVMVLGDSLTWGVGLAQEERYSNLLEQRLRADGIEVEVLNFGLPGLSTVAELEVLRENMPEVRPDRIAIGFCINDPQERTQDWSVELDDWQWLFRGCRLLDQIHLTETAWLVRQGLVAVLVGWGAVPDWITALDRAYHPDSEAWRGFTAALREIKALSDQMGLPPPLIMPLLSGDGDFAAPTRELAYTLRWTRLAKQAARESGLEIVDLEPYFIGQGARNRKINPWDGHPDAQCNQIYADALYRALRPTM